MIPLPEFSDYASARLLSARPAAAEQAHLVVEPPPGFVEAHRRAGQFCRIRVGDAEGIFAMASPPGESPVRFLVRVGNPDGGEAADRLAELEDGGAIEMSSPAGQGFGLDSREGGDLVFVATGTGVAPVCAAIEEVLSHRARWGALTLVHGVRSEAHVAIADDIRRWAERGLTTRLCYSHLDERGELVGEPVQDALRRARPDLSGCSVIGVGQPEMLASLLEVVVELGGSEVRFFTNL